MPQDVAVAFKRHEEKKTRPQLDELLNLLESTIGRLSKCYIIIDAFDEHVVDGTSDDVLLKALKRLEPAAHVLVTSRLVPYLEKHFNGALRLEICAKDEDVNKYIQQVIKSAPRLQSHVTAESTLLDAITTAITTSCKGMLVSSLTVSIIPLNINQVSNR